MREVLRAPRRDWWRGIEPKGKRDCFVLAGDRVEVAAALGVALSDLAPLKWAKVEDRKDVPTGIRNVVPEGHEDRKRGKARPRKGHCAFVKVGVAWRETYLTMNGLEVKR